MRLAPLVDPGPPLSQPQIERLSRHLLLPEIGVAGQRRLLHARVLVIGAGGLGAPILQYLAAAGVGTLGIVDDDVVDTTNLQRQIIHGSSDVGRLKVDSAAETLAGLSPDVTVVPHTQRLTAANVDEVMAGYDLVLDGADNFPTRYVVSDAAARAGIPVVWGSILRFDAQVSVFWAQPFADDGGVLPGVTLRDLFPTPPPPGTTPSCGEAGVLGSMCGQVGSLMASEAIKLITGAGEPLLGRVAILDVLRPSMTVVPLRGAAGAAPTVPGDPAARGYLLPAEEAAGVTLEAACVVAPNRPSPPAEVPEIDVAALAAAREEGRLDGERLVVLDVREPHEWQIAAIEGTVRVPLARVLEDPAGVAHEAGMDDAVVAVHCLSGARSRRATAALREAGVRTVNVEGGIRAWSQRVDPAVPTY